MDKKAGTPKGGGAGNERGRKTLTCFGCGSKSSVLGGEGRGGEVVVPGHLVHECVGPLICWIPNRL